MTPAETETELRALFKKLRPPARAICHFHILRRNMSSEGGSLLQGCAGTGVLWQVDNLGLPEDSQRKRDGVKGQL